MEPEARIAAALPVRAPPGLPAMRLHLAGPRSRLAGLCAELKSDAPPYWAHVWGGGLALARFLVARPQIVRGRRVVDLGTGCGVVAIAAGLAGAAQVAAVDIEPLALIATRLNAELNGVRIETLCADALAGATPDAEIVLAGDLFYEAGLAARAGRFLARCASQGRRTLLGDPGRTSFAIEAFLGARVVSLVDERGADFGGAGRLRVFAVEAAPSALPPRGGSD